MKLAVITPVGPGHQYLEDRSRQSFLAAMETGRGQFTEIRHTYIPDHQGALGRSKARNQGMEMNSDADWYFFLDADDILVPECFVRFSEQADIVFGYIYTFHRKYVQMHGALNRTKQPRKCWSDLLEKPAVGGVAMGCYVRGPPAREIGFNEEMDVAEDWEFFLTFCSQHEYAKIDQPLCRVGNNIPSACGPRGFRHPAEWLDRVEFVRDFWRERGRVPISKEERSELARRTGRKTYEARFGQNP